MKTCTFIASALALAAYASPALLPTDADARAVTLRDARVAPTELRLLQPHARITYATPTGENCTGGGYFSDVSAYRWNGEALGAQVHRSLRDRWTVPGTRTHVTFDGVTFRNHASVPVLIAGWCEDPNA
jgi:hypothetical protein